MSEINNLIKKVGISLIAVNVLWISIMPIYFINPIYFNFNFYRFRLRFNIINAIQLFQGLITLKIIYNIKNA
jgi:hypothetical protein